MRPLIITNDTLLKIKAAVEYAEAHPIPWSELKEGALGEEVKELKLVDRKPGFERPLSENVLIPVGFRVAFSVEEQPAGWLHHLSVSVDTPGKLPSIPAVVMICKEYGIKNWDRVWVEEFDPGHSAVNILELYKPREEHKS